MVVDKQDGYSVKRHQEQYEQEEVQAGISIVMIVSVILATQSVSCSAPVRQAKLFVCCCVQHKK